LHTSIPGFVVRDEEVVVVRSLFIGFNNRFINGSLRFVHGLGEVDGKVLVAAASAVSRAIIRADGTLAGTTFESGVADALASGGIALTTIRAFSSVAVIEIGLSFDPAPALATRACHQRAVCSAPQFGAGRIGALTIAVAMIHRVAGTVTTACVRARSTGETNKGGKGEEEFHVFVYQEVSS